MTIHTCVVGFDEVFRAGLGSILRRDGFEIVGTFEDCSEMEGGNIPPEFLAVVDLPCAEHQVETLDRFKLLYPLSSVAILSDSFEMNSMIECFRLGAHGFIMKSLPLPALITSLRLVALGEKVLPSKVTDELLQDSTGSPSATETDTTIETAGLSKREYDVLHCLMVGHPNKTIARELDLCEATVKVHVKAIIRKLQVSNRTQAAVWGQRHGIDKNYESSEPP